MSNTIEVTKKKWYQSRTIWVMVGFALMPLIYMYLIKDPLPLESVLYASGQALVAIYMRFITRQPITEEFLEEVVGDAVGDVMDKKDEIDNKKE